MGQRLVGLAELKERHAAPVEQFDVVRRNTETGIKALECPLEFFAAGIKQAVLAKLCRLHLEQDNLGDVVECCVDLKTTTGTIAARRAMASGYPRGLPGPRAAGGFGLDIDLDVSLPGLPRADAEALVAKAHQVCPYSNATRGNVDVRLKVV